MTYTFNTTAKQDAVLAYALARHNRESATPYADVQALLTAQFLDRMQPYLAEFEAVEKQRVGQAYAAASGAVQARVRTELGL